MPYCFGQGNLIMVLFILIINFAISISPCEENYNNNTITQKVTSSAKPPDCVIPDNLSGGKCHLHGS